MTNQNESKAKRRLVVTSLCYLLILLLIFSMVGLIVYAATNKSFNFGGNVSFSADGVEATVSEATLNNCTATTNTTSTDSDGNILSALQEITYSTDKDTDNHTTMEQTWCDLDIELTDEVATISFTITNNSDEDALLVTISGIDEFSDTDIIASLTSSVTRSTALKTTNTVSTFNLLSNTSSAETSMENAEIITINAGASVTYTLTFTVPDTAHDANLENFSISIKLEKAEIEEKTSSLSTISTMVWYDEEGNEFDNFSGDEIWTDGKNYYYSELEALNGGQYVLVDNNIWGEMTWYGLTDFSGCFVWTDGTDIYYSYDSDQYVLNVSTFTWETKTWDGYYCSTGACVWTDGTDIYYSNGSDQYILNDSTHTWETKTWNGLSSFSALYIWTDGTNIYYSYGSDQYVLNVSTFTWETMSWNELTDFNGSDIWTDGTDIYYSYGSDQYILNDDGTWETKTWNGLSSFSALYIWTDGTNIYYSFGFWGSTPYEHYIFS